MSMDQSREIEMEGSGRLGEACGQNQVLSPGQSTYHLSQGPPDPRKLEKFKLCCSADGAKKATQIRGTCFGSSLAGLVLSPCCTFRRFWYFGSMG
jgi:hypothetical protein